MAYIPAITLERTGSESLTAQIVAQVRGSILLGELSSGERVPSTRALAARLGVSRGSVVTAFEQLSGEGYLVTTQGRGLTSIGTVVGAKQLRVITVG